MPDHREECTVFEGIHQEAELLLSLLRSESENLEHFGLQLCIVDTDGTSTHFNTVAHHIVCICTDSCRVCIQQRNIFVFRMSERVVHSHQAAFFIAPLKHREVNHPKADELVLVA